MAIMALDHVQIAIPENQEDAARKFYIDLLGFEEVEKPLVLKERGGLWLRAGTVHLHLGADERFQPALKAHPAFLCDDLSTLQKALAASGYPMQHDAHLKGYDRFFTEDPWGNRIELMSRTT
ncbi:VOC family protein [Pseudovibrio exalbescens]|uniref:VOC family protein n=1 Tax=Pseudovibrio exalbescens TaxID=197461 RepID=UPI000C9CBB1B|nr:VOC family protein [Pseudovibrio exalbescens]